MIDRPEKVLVELDREAIEAASAAGLDLSHVLTEALRRKLPGLHRAERERAARQWYEENKEAVNWHNQFIAEHGLLSDHFRKF
jgi:antitoxin CcdA